MPGDATLIIANAAIVDNAKIISPAYLTLTDGIFTRVASTPPPKKEAHDINLPQTLLLPGFVNAHCHLELTALGPLPRNHFVPWVQDLLPRKVQLSADSIQAGIRHGCELLLQSGVTTIIDHISSETPLRFFENLPLSVIGFGEVLGVEKSRAEKSYQSLLDAKIQAPLPFHITPHAFYSLHADVMQAVLQNESAPFSIHYLESAEEREFFETQSGALWEFCRGGFQTRPNSRAGTLRAQVLEPAPTRSLLIHANEITDTDLVLIKKKQNTIVHCPGSFAFFKHKNFPHDKIRAAGIPIALGTDSLASNFSLNFLDEIRRFVALFPPKDIFELLPLITTNALTALGINNAGKIAEGLPANLVGFNNPKELTPLHILQESQQADFVMTEKKRVVGHKT